MNDLSWMNEVANHAKKIFQQHQVRLSLGGEPTYVPLNPNGPEWNYSAVGPEKLGFAEKLAAALIEDVLLDGTPFFSPGKQYPGETNPRWALRILFSKNHTPLSSDTSHHCKDFTALRRKLGRTLGVATDWARFHDSSAPESDVRAILLDHDGEKWCTTPWKLTPGQCRLLPAEGPAGLRLPLQLLPADVTRRSLTLEKKGNSLSIFFPPLLEKPFLELLVFFKIALPQEANLQVHYQGYLPPSLGPEWSVLGLASDPGVLEINLPPCADWQEYAGWIEVLDRNALRVGLRAWREDRGEFPTGTGGGNHLLFGSPDGEKNSFYERPEWLASFLTYWQSHPSLSYLFTGDYVGAASQAPRPDESGISLSELDLALQDLRSAEDPPTPYFMAENLRHLLVDSAGNPHRAEISLDKFYDMNHPAGLLGLIEFRAIETLPFPLWTNTVALLWVALAARLLQHPARYSLVDLEKKLHDQYFLPSFLWADLLQVLADCKSSKMAFDETLFRKMWEWKFPTLLEWESNAAKLTIRRAHESWPLLAEVPNEGGTTSRFVDSSLRRLELCGNAAFEKQYSLCMNGNPLPLQSHLPDQYLAGLRYRHGNLYPALHPRRPIQLPLELQIIQRKNNRLVGAFLLEAGESQFQLTESSSTFVKDAGVVAPIFDGAFTRDLRKAFYL